MKRVNLSLLCLTAIACTTLHTMNDDHNDDLGLRNLFQEEAESPRAPLPRIQTPRPQTPGRRTPLQNITGSESRAGTPVLAIRPIELDAASRPNTPTRIGTPRQTPPTTTINALIAAHDRGEIDDAELGRRIRVLFPRRMPTPRSEQENASPQHPNILRD